jgi:hypothetical protein
MTGAPDPAARLADLIRLFGPLARSAGARPICWIAGANDPGEDYCETCARWRVRRLRRDGSYPDAEVDGGWDPARDTEGPAFCHGCSRLLGYSLKPIGVAEELDRWRDHTWDAAVTPVDAYQIEAVLTAAEAYGGEQAWMIPEAIAVGERAAPHLPA